MDNVRKFLPKDKYDVAGVRRIALLSEEEVRPVLGDLLEWLQDLNWPIASEVVKILPKYTKSLLPHLHTILDEANADGIWKYWIIKELLPLLNKEIVNDLYTELKRIAMEPTAGEKDSGADEVASKLLEE